MGMVEDRKNWAAGTISHSERMFLETGNPYFVVAAIAAAKTGDFLPPDWALTVLVEAIHKAYWSASSGTSVSIDKAIGLATKRGGSPRKAKAMRESEEAVVFDDIKAIHSCFDISIPEACELVFYEIDYSFGRQMEEVIESEIEFGPDIASLGMSRDDIDSLNAKIRLRNREVVESPLHNESVRAKLREGKWWEVRTADRIGYGLDHLIERYHRVGTRMAARKLEQVEERNRKLSTHLRGSMLLLSRTIRISSIGDVPADCKLASPALRLPQREDFRVSLAQWSEKGLFTPLT